MEQKESQLLSSAYFTDTQKHGWNTVHAEWKSCFSGLQSAGAPSSGHFEPSMTAPEGVMSVFLRIIFCFCLRLHKSVLSYWCYEYFQSRSSRSSRAEATVGFFLPLQCQLFLENT